MLSVKARIDQGEEKRKKETRKKKKARQKKKKNSEIHFFSSFLMASKLFDTLQIN